MGHGRPSRAIAGQIFSIEQMVLQVASAAEEQSQVAVEIDRSIQEIANQSDESASTAHNVKHTCEKLADQAEDQLEMAERFIT